MDYQRFIHQLRELYENLGQESIRPKSEQFQAVLDKVQGMTTANVMQLLNFAVECMETDEVYCEVGCFQGATLIGALLNHPEQMTYAVDNFSEFDDSGENLEQLSKNLSLFDLEQQVIFCNQDFEEFCFDLKEIDSHLKIGVYFYDGAHDYRSQLLGLLLVKPFLAEKALIIVDDSNWSCVQQANWDFMAAHPQCQLLLDLPTPRDGHCTFWNGIQVFSWDVNQETSYSWSTFAEKFRNKPVIKALYEFSSEFELSQKKNILSSLYKEALLLYTSGQLLEAEKKYRKVLQWDSYHAKAWHDLGIVYYKRLQYQDALEHILKSLEIDPSIGIHYQSLGLVLEELGHTSQAMEAYQQAIILNPQSIDAYNRLGNILSNLGELEQAASIYRQAIASEPNHFGSYLNLGNILMAQHQIDEAIKVYEKSLQLKPRNPDTLHNLGVAFEAKNDQEQAALHFGYAAYRQGKYAEAIIKYEKFLSTQVGDINFYVALADCYKCLNREEEALNIYQEGLKHYHNSAGLYLHLTLTLQNYGRIQEAIAVASEASQLLPNNLALKLEKQRLLPIIYDTPEEIDFYRDRFTQHLEDLIQQTALDSPEVINTALQGIGWKTNFYIQYQCKNDLDLQSRYGQFVHRVMAANYPQWVKPLPMPLLRGSSKVRVGYVCNFIYGHTVNKLFIGWIKNHNSNNFEIYCYYTNPKVDSMTQQVRVYSHVFHHIPNDLEAICQQIISDHLHVLVFLEIGMAQNITQIASLRLAPIQCLTWGHPITSGIPTIDYFLSSHFMEPENAEEHYSEKLVRLPNIGISYTKPVFPKNLKKRSEFQLHEDAVVYLSCQSIYKYLPQYDYLFAAIAQRVPQAQFAFIESQTSKSITEQFRQRLKRAFTKLELNNEEYCLMLPRFNQEDYLNLNLVSDIFLDTLDWSGGNTTLEAIACNLPVVTCPGEFMRGRHSYGILKMLGVTETIAEDEAEYIEIAVRLGLDPDWRQSIVQKIRDGHSRLYDDKTCVRALEEFYQRVVQEGQTQAKLEPEIS